MRVDIPTLEEKIKRVKKSISDKPTRTGEGPGPADFRYDRKRLKRLQRRRRVLIAMTQRGKLAKDEAEVKGAAQPAEAVKAEKKELGKEEKKRAKKEEKKAEAKKTESPAS